MGQQPKVEIPAEALPRPVPQPGPAHRWRAGKPGIPDGPAEWPEGGMFSVTGPDPGWALRLIALAELPDDDDRLPKVLSGLMLARSAELGRAPVREDLAAALLVCGYGKGLPDHLVQRRRRWLEAVPHEQRPGETAVAEIDREFLAQPIGEIERTLRIEGSELGSRSG